MTKHTRRLRLAAALAIGALALTVVPAATASAAQAEPALSSYAWYWKTQKSQPITDPTSGSDVATVELPSPFCPQAPGMGSPGGGAACEEGRLPVEVKGGDYDEPDKMSAVGFDLALVPLGSTVQRFTATFVEADGKQSQPINAEGKSLRACPIAEFFGNGEAREYEEAPDFECTDADPVAERKEMKVGGEDRFGYTFDLTQMAGAWLAEGAPVTAVMLMPVKPENFNGATDNEWRTVLAGPGEEDAVQTRLRYTPGEGLAPPPDMGGGFDTGADLGGGFTGGSDFGSDFGTDTGTGFGEADFGADAGAGEAGEQAPTEVSDLEFAAGEVPEGAGALPGYVWLAILAGMIGFSAVRSVVLESAHGIRPDGVLAQIRQINSGRGAAAAAAGPSPLAGIATLFRGAGERITALVHKLPFLKKG